MTKNIHSSRLSIVARCAGMLALAATLSLANPGKPLAIASARTQSSTTVTATGQVIDSTGHFSWIFDFNPAGGPISNSYVSDFVWNSSYEIITSQGTVRLSGYFEGGDGGKVSGTYMAHTIYVNEQNGSSEWGNSEGEDSWEGYLYADGTGKGTMGADRTWSVTFDAQAFQSALGNEPTVGAELPLAIPALDQEAIDQINNLVENPIVPVAGAVGGAALASLIAALLGRSPAAAGNLPSTGLRGPKPGAVDASGRLYSPVSGGWVSPQMYDYQKTWSEKGWRWNSATGRFEGQQGAVNEKGQVMDDELGWVDQKTFAENQQMRSQGFVYDRNLGWQAPEKLRENQIEQDALRQRSRDFSAEKNAQLQQEIKDASQKSQEEYQKWLKQYEDKERIRQSMDAAQDEFRRQRAIDNKLALKEFLLKSVAFTADVAFAIPAKMCGPIGEVYQTAYDEAKLVAGAAEEAYHEGSLKAGVKKYIKDSITDGIVKKVTGKISDWTPKFIKNAASKYIEKPIKKQLFDAYGKPALKGAQGVLGTLKDKAFESALGDTPGDMSDFVVDEAEKHPELIL